MRLSISNCLCIISIEHFPIRFWPIQNVFCSCVSNVFRREKKTNVAYLMCVVASGRELLCFVFCCFFFSLILYNISFCFDFVFAASRAVLCSNRISMVCLGSISRLKRASTFALFFIRLVSHSHHNIQLRINHKTTRTTNKNNKLFFFHLSSFLPFTHSLSRLRALFLTLSFCVCLASVSKKISVFLCCVFYLQLCRFLSKCYAHTHRQTYRRWWLSMCWCIKYSYMSL